MSSKRRFIIFCYLLQVRRLFVFSVLWTEDKDAARIFFVAWLLLVEAVLASYVYIVSRNICPYFGHFLSLDAKAIFKLLS